MLLQRMRFSGLSKMIFSGIKSVLVLKLRHIGDVLLTVPVFRALKETFPDARVSALVNAGTEAVLQGNPLINDIIVLDRGVKSLPPATRLLKEWSFLRALSKRAFDMTVDLTGGDRAAVASFATGAKVRIGLNSGEGLMGKRLLYTHLSSPDVHKHTVFYNLEIVRPFGISTDDHSIDFYTSEEDRVFIDKVLEEHKVGAGAMIVHVHPTSRWLFKCWNDNYMADVIRWLLEKDMFVAVTASPDSREIEKAGRILELVGERQRLIDLRGKTTIKQLGALSKASRLFFGVDSAPMHIAAAVGTPVVALFGPSGAFNWGPWDNNERGVSSGSPAVTPYAKRNGIQTFGIHTVIQQERDCVPCGCDGCAGSKTSDCLEEIKASVVKEILAERLKTGVSS
ncbi:MAG: putative lipopolysaccharide heptosyltransferase III [Nitrospirae bacterium]|nr:putative lipopolysaccharide heptosyltransferase III [Nitrospirota bacterium]